MKPLPCTRLRFTDPLQCTMYPMSFSHKTSCISRLKNILSYKKPVPHIFYTRHGKKMMGTGCSRILPVPFISISALIPPVPGAGFHPGPPPPSPEKKGIGSHPLVRYFLEQP